MTPAWAARCTPTSAGMSAAPMSPPPLAEPDEVEAVVGRYYIRRTDDNDAEKTLRDGAKSPLNYRNATGALILEAQSGRLAGGCIIMKGINSTKPPKKSP